MPMEKQETCLRIVLRGRKEVKLTFRKSKGEMLRKKVEMMGNP
jgi:hypothetical protein